LDARGEVQQVQLVLEARRRHAQLFRGQPQRAAHCPTPFGGIFGCIRFRPCNWITRHGASVPGLHVGLCLGIGYPLVEDGRHLMNLGLLGDRPDPFAIEQVIRWNGREGLTRTPNRHRRKDTAAACFIDFVRRRTRPVTDGPIRRTLYLVDREIAYNAKKYTHVNDSCVSR